MEKWHFRKWSRAWPIGDLSLRRLTGCTARKRKRERGGRPVVRLGPETPSILFDNRASDEQPYPHPAALCRVERIEHGARALRGQAHARIVNDQTDAVAVDVFGPNPQQPRPVVDVDHGV